MRYVYIVECADKTLYTGITTDLVRRESEHNFSEKSAKYTRIRRPVKIVFSQACENRSQASKLEYKIKQLTKVKKLQIIEKQNIEL
jgi:putative endonuclease